MTYRVENKSPVPQLFFCKDSKGRGVKIEDLRPGESRTIDLIDPKSPFNAGRVIAGVISIEQSSKVEK